MKTKKTISKHDIIRSIKALRYRLDNLLTVFQMQQQEFQEYLEYKDESEKFENFLKEKQLPFCCVNIFAPTAFFLHTFAWKMLETVRESFSSETKLFWHLGAPKIISFWGSFGVHCGPLRGLHFGAFDML